MAMPELRLLETVARSKIRQAANQAIMPGLKELLYNHPRPRIHSKY